MELHEIARRLSRLVRRRRLTAQLREEIAGHREALEEQYRHEGLDQYEARRRAHLQFGGAGQIEEAATDVWRWRRIEHLWRDLRLAARRLRRQPAFTVAAVATFALGIGAATAIFSIAYGIAFRPLPYPNADRLVRLYEANTATAESKLQVSQGTFQGWREMVPSLEQLALFGRGSVWYTTGETPQPVTIVPVSPRFFDVIDVAPAMGRTFRADSEYTRFTSNELVASHAAWERLLGGDPAIFDRAVSFRDRGTPMRVVGVMPRGFAFGPAADFWKVEAIELPIARVVRSWRYDHAVGRLRSDRTLADLRAELDRASAQLGSEFPATNGGWKATVEPLKAAVVGGAGRASWLLLGAVAAVLLVACANVAGLLTARAIGRARETSVRIALGAGWARLVQLFLAEAFTLAALGAAVGLVLTWAVVRLFRSIAPPGLPRVDDIAVDVPTLLIAAAATVTAAIVCGAVPLFAIRARALADGLRHGGSRGGDWPARRRLTTSVVGIQSAAAVALVVISVVFARSFFALTAVDLGWRPDQVLSLQAAPRFPPENRRPWWLYAQWSEQLVARLEATPGIVRAAVTTTVPFSPDTYPAEIARGQDKRPDETRWPIGLHVVTPGYFETMGIAIRRGRAFKQSDRFDEATLTAADAPPGVAIVTESVARALWPGQDPIGQTFRVPAQVRMPFLTVIGVVGDVQFTTVGAEPPLNVFLPWLQSPTGAPRLLVRTAGDPADVAPLVRAAAMQENAHGLVDRMIPETTLVDRALAPARVTSQTMAGLGALAVVLAGVGIYGALSTLVAARTREIAVRLALGASARHTLWRTLAAGLWPVAAGGAAGIAVAVGLTSAIRSLLFGVTRADAGSVAIGASLVLGAALVACLFPALRASRTDPLRVLRGD